MYPLYLSISGSGETVTEEDREALKECVAKVSSSVQSISHEHKDIHASISKYGRVIDKVGREKKIYCVGSLFVIIVQFFYVYTCTYTYECLHVHSVHVWIYTCTYECLHVHSLHVWINMCTCTYECLHVHGVHVWIYTCTCTYECLHVHGVYV